MNEFLANNRDSLIARCIEKVARRPKRAATEQQLKNGVPMFIDQLTRTLKAEQDNQDGISLQISGPSGGDVSRLSEMGLTATAHGKALLHLGYSVDQVVHDYGDLCQAITDLAFERDAPFSIDEYRTLNRCLDNAIADAVSEFSAQRDAALTAQRVIHENQQLGFLMHELRNALGTASLAATAMEIGNLTPAGATGAVLRRSHAAMASLISNALAEVSLKNKASGQQPLLSLAAFIADAKSDADLYATTQGCRFTVADVDPRLGIKVNHDLLLAALMNLLHNAFKFTHRHTEVTLEAYAVGERILIDVKDHCGGLPPGNTEKMFKPFSQRSDDKTGMGLGLSIARKSIEADGGTLSVRDRPGTGCTFTINLPRHSLD
ncbi:MULTISPECIES: sensor histidine kinase KdpD [unclassified Polaromonas]|nr:MULTISPECIES: HAMP domain-containing sensor histidine kinase [unclassified Polaromonas]MBG6070662.1 signal transduction histidine kinase [Polaromonas sp. CG_9.7]MBG6113030.1 signal transduction histidine kinase [Polaromonas sp. CG_9.2]MDH6186503.1 signal transduction histidine kinase [Polaromonas sp. CG_23.6]